MFSPRLRDDLYFIARWAVAVSLVRGGPPPGFVAPPQLSCGWQVVKKPFLKDAVDTDLYEKVKTVNIF